MYVPYEIVRLIFESVQMRSWIGSSESVLETYEIVLEEMPWIR
jgi:hypothetical protein